MYVGSTALGGLEIGVRPNCAYTFEVAVIEKYKESREAAAIDIINAMMITSTDVTFIIEEISSNVIFQRIADRWLLNTSFLLPAWTRRKGIIFYFILVY